MSTFKDFLLEQDGKQVIDQAADAIVRDCKPYVRQDGGVQFNFFRGMDIQDSLFVHKRVRKNREPLSTPPAVHHFLNQWFKEHFNYPYRSEGLFATASPLQAEEFAEMNDGGIYTIYPIGQFNFLWSPTIVDLFGKLAEIDRYLDDEYGEDHTLGIVGGKYPTTLSKLQQQAIMDMLNANTFKTDDLGRAAKTQHEIMFACDSYYALDHSIDTKVLAQVIKERL